MKYNNHKVSDIRLAYIGGGSRGWAWKFMTDLAMEPALSGDVVLYDIDHEAAEANKTIGNRIDQMPDTLGHWRYQVAETLEEALQDADFVVISILPGTFDEMAVDIHMPERLGIWQSVGDTAGPGGIIRGLRTVPMYVTIAEGIQKLCPQAWVINYTNPMALCVQTLYHVFPEIKAFGCCHEVFNTQEVLAAAVSEQLGVPTPTRREIHVNVLGINHFTWFDRASWEGVDLFPVYQRFSNQYYESGFHEKNQNWMNSSFACGHRVKFDLFRRYGCIAAAGDRHLVEFMPGNTYLKDPETVREWMFGLTTAQWRKEDLQKRLQKSRDMVSGCVAIDRTPSGEEGVLLMKALVGLGRIVSNVNIPNRGQIANLPLGAVVETNALFEKDAIYPVLAGSLPEPIRELTISHIEIQQMTLRAALECDMALVVEALLKDPNTNTKCADGRKLRELAEDMIEGTMEYLPSRWM